MWSSNSAVSPCLCGCPGPSSGPSTSTELAAAWQEEIRFCIDTFGPSRCLFESNFPVDKRGCSYVVLWNAFKRIATDYSPSEKRDLFHNSAARAYRLRSIP